MSARPPIAMFASRAMPADESFFAREADALRRCGQPVVSRRMPGITHVHGHGATTRAWMTSKLTGVPFSMTVYAHSLFTRRTLLREKVRDARFVRTTSEFSRRFLESLYPAESHGKVFVVHVGAVAREGGTTLGVAAPASRERHKGRRVFEEALALLDGEIPVTSFAEAAIYVQPSTIAPNGLMDGIPIPLIDAMASGKAVIASAISGIPEVVVHGETGLLVDPANPRMLADAIRTLANDPALRARLGANAREKVVREFDLETSAKQLIALLEQFA